MGSATFRLLAGGGFFARDVAVDGVEMEQEVSLNFVSSGFFRTLGIELLAGRDFGDADIAGAPAVAIVNQRFAERLGLEGDLIGRSVAFGPGSIEIVGLVANAKSEEVTGEIGVLAYSVAQRSREIGLRFALGAPPSRIRRMVLRQVAAVALIGVVLGMVAAWLLGRAAQSLLYGVEAGDPVALAAAAAVLAVVMLGAAYIPARRASRVDPMRVLRYE